MAHSHLTLRAILFDVYGTLLSVGPPPTDADVRWDNLFRELFGSSPSQSRLEFSVACSQVIAHHHRAARAKGIPRPEVLWPAVVAEVLPNVARLPAPIQAEFIFRQMQIGRTLQLHKGVGQTLAAARQKGLLLGIASNSQAYTLRELQDALRAVDLDLDIFDREVRFWSFANGFSKPDPHVFQMLTARLEARGIAVAEILMVGDRRDNDMAPAQLFGWQTWRICEQGQAGENAGTWFQLQAWLDKQPGY